MTKIIYLIGKPGTGKYTIAKELAKTGFVICDSQHINNPIFELLNYDGISSVPRFAWDAIYKLRKCVFEFLVNEKNNSYVLTNVLFGDEHELFNQVKEMALARNSLFIPVKLLISQEENIRRVQNVTRLERFKSITIESLELERELIEINHPNLLELNVTNLSAVQAAQEILNHTKAFI